MRYFVNEQEVSEKDYNNIVGEEYVTLSFDELLNEMIKQIDRLILNMIDEIMLEEKCNTFSLWCLLNYYVDNRPLVDIDSLFNNDILTIFNQMTHNLIVDYTDGGMDPNEDPISISEYYNLLGHFKSAIYASVFYDCLSEDVDTEKKPYSDAIIEADLILYFMKYDNYSDLIENYGEYISNRLIKKYKYEYNINPLVEYEHGMLYEDLVKNKLINNRQYMVKYMLDNMKEW